MKQQPNATKYRSQYMVFGIILVYIPLVYNNSELNLDKEFKRIAFNYKIIQTFLTDTNSYKRTIKRDSPSLKS